MYLYEMNNLNISFPEACRMNVIAKTKIDDLFETKFYM